MPDYINVFQYRDWISLSLNAGDGRVLAVGEKMEAARPEAYMNGYNWEAFFRYYLEKNAPDILEGMDADPEADAYIARWPLSPENQARAERFEKLIRSLLENGEELCRIVREEGDEIEWD